MSSCAHRVDPSRRLVLRGFAGVLFPPSTGEAVFPYESVRQTGECLGAILSFLSEIQYQIKRKMNYPNFTEWLRYTGYSIGTYFLTEDCLPSLQDTPDRSHLLGK
jgi:hypothetical protein